jgi:hypothetical protein
MPQRLALEVRADEVVRLALGPLILLRAGGVVAGEVKVTESYTRLGIIFWNFFFFLSLKWYFFLSSPLL